MAAHCLSLISLRKATRETETSSSCIDAIFGNVPLLKSTIEKTSFSDHYSFHLKLDLEYEAIECIYRFRCLKKLENRDYSEKFSFYLAHTLGKIEETGQSGEAYITKVADVTKRVTDKYFPCQNLKKFSSRKTWITNRIKRHIKIRDKLFQLWLNSKSERAHLNYKNKRNEINMEIKLAKRRGVQNKIDHKDPREFFNYIRKMKGVVFDTKINGDLTANAFNEYFLNACEPIVSPILDYCIASDNNQQTQSMYFSYVTDEEVCTIIKEIKNKKSIGFDGIDVKILKHSAEIICQYLCIGLNKCISEGFFPRIMKIAKVIPIHKEGKKASPSNYRPISFLGNLSKIFEKVIQKRLIRYLEKFPLLTENQFGFKKRKILFKLLRCCGKQYNLIGPLKQTRWVFFSIFAKLLIL